MTHHPRKRFGQHFLHDFSVIDRIAQAIRPRPGDQLVEIGPGLGALTTVLLPLVTTMTAVELDRDLIAPLTAKCKPLGNLTLIQADVLDFDFTHITSKPHSLRVVGNLPYEISTPLIFHLIEHIDIIQDLHFMLQKEVVDRLASPIGTKHYGRLSIMIQYYFDVEPLFTVGPEAFDPPPKVNSAVVRLTPKAAQVPCRNFPRFAEIVKQAFNYRRKTLHNCLKGMVTNVQMLSLNIDPNSRPEQITVEQFVQMANL